MERANSFEKTPQFLTVKGFYSRFRYFAFATQPEAGVTAYAQPWRDNLHYWVVRDFSKINPLQLICQRQCTDFKFLTQLLFQNIAKKL